MTDDFIGVDITGIKEIEKKLKALPPAVAGEAVDAVSVYLVNVYQQYPPKRSVSRADAYPDAPAGPGWFSDKQRRWFFAALADSRIGVPYSRTQTLRKGWEIIGKGLKSIIVNTVPYAGIVMGDGLQSRHERMVGWRTIGALTLSSMAKAQKVLDGAAKKAIKKLQLD